MRMASGLVSSSVQRADLPNPDLARALLFFFARVRGVGFGQGSGFQDLAWASWRVWGVRGVSVAWGGSSASGSGPRNWANDARAYLDSTSHPWFPRASQNGSFPNPGLGHSLPVAPV